MVRVLHYIGLLEFGGSQSFVMEIYRKIDRSKLQFDFVTFPNQKKDNYNEIISLGGRVFESPQYTGKNHFTFVTWWKEFFDKHREYKILHVHVRSVGAICIDIAHYYNILCIAHSHSTSNGRGIRAKIKNIMQFSIRYKADYMFACSKEAGEWLFGKNVNKKNNYKVIANAIDAQRFDYDENTRNNVRRLLKIEDKFVVGHIGRMTEPKNHLFLIKIFSDICKIRQDARLLLIGDGELREIIEKEIQARNLEDKVLILGSRNNTEDYYQAMDVFVFPSLWEGLGISVIEAQTSGLPCLISERIPKDAVLDNQLVEIMCLSMGEKQWAKKVVNMKRYRREGNVEVTRICGYDVVKNAKYLQNFYMDLVVQKRDGKCI